MQVTAVFQRDGDWWVAWAVELPAAMSQGTTLEEARENLLDAIQEVLAEAREAAERDLMPGAIRETLDIAA